MGGRAGSPPFNPTLMHNVSGRPTVPGNLQSGPGMPTGLATPPVASKFSRKAHGGSRHGELLVKFHAIVSEDQLSIQIYTCQLRGNLFDVTD